MYFLSDKMGIDQLVKYNLKTNKQQDISKFLLDIKDYDLFTGTSQMAYTMKEKGKEFIYLDKNYVEKSNTEELFTERAFKRQEELGLISKPTVITPEPEKKSGTEILYQSSDVDTSETLNPDDLQFKSEEEINTDYYVFDFEKNNDKSDDIVVNSKTTYNTNSQEIKEEQIKRVGPVKYKNQLSFDKTTTSVMFDNLMEFGTYMDVSLVDMLGNHKITGGLFGRLDFANSSMFAQYEYLKRRVDYRFKITKTRLFLNSETYVHKYGLNKFETSFSYPLSNTTRISYSPSFIDLFFLQLTPGFFANKTDTRSNFLSNKFEFVYDNTKFYGLNMIEGFRIKANYENFFSPGNYEKGFAMADLDARAYIKLHKELVFAMRGSGGAFMGASKKNFILGGMDNWVYGSNDFSGTENPLNGMTDNYINGYPDILLHKFVNNMRGFQRASLYGNKYFLLNAELRWPIIRYFYKKRTIPSPILRNLQISGFGDFGSAWSGSSPFERENNYNIIPFDKQPYSGQVTTFRSPLLTSYGFGIRSYLSSYCLKLDVAWGIRDYKQQEPKFVLSLGHDF